MISSDSNKLKPTIHIEDRGASPEELLYNIFNRADITFGKPIGDLVSLTSEMIDSLGLAVEAVIESDVKNEYICAQGAASRLHTDIISQAAHWEVKR